jgi:hypothetical protein
MKRALFLSLLIIGPAFADTVDCFNENGERVCVSSTNNQGNDFSMHSGQVINYTRQRVCTWFIRNNAGAAFKKITHCTAIRVR